MLDYWRHINWKALFIVFFAFYPLPALSAIALANLLLPASPGPIESGSAFAFFAGLFSWWLIAPVGAGYLAARLAGRLPLLHALITVLFGYLFQAATTTIAFWWVLPVWALISIAGGFFGAFVWQLQRPRQP
jgi:hypothetical protein